jgi:hypothetical protein
MPTLDPNLIQPNTHHTAITHHPTQSFSVLFRPRRAQIVREQLALQRAGKDPYAWDAEEKKGAGKSHSSNSRSSNKSAVVVPEDVEAGNKAAAGHLRGSVIE